MMNNISGIYKIICKNNNKFYIGSSVNIDRRLKDHIRFLRKNKHYNLYLQNSWNRYGEKNFRYEIIENIYNIKDLYAREKWWIDATNCCNRKIGFNVSSDPQAPGKGSFIDLTGQRFGKLIAIKPNGKTKGGNYLWECICDCGKETIVAGKSLKDSSTKSCGCLQKEMACEASKLRIRHGHSTNDKTSRTYNTWRRMAQKCTNKNHPAYKYYGGRNPPIAVCKRWSNNKNGFQNFLEDIGEIPKGKSLDRINNNGNYSPKNCKLRNKFYDYKNKKQCITDLAQEYKMSPQTLQYRLNKAGWSLKRALSTPIRKYKKRK